jgi:hypothetical protein
MTKLAEGVAAVDAAAAAEAEEKRAVAQSAAAKAENKAAAAAAAKTTAARKSQKAAKKQCHAATMTPVEEEGVEEEEGIGGAIPDFTPLTCSTLVDACRHSESGVLSLEANGCVCTLLAYNAKAHTYRSGIRWSGRAHQGRP